MRFLLMVAALITVSGSASADSYGAPPSNLPQLLDALIAAYPDYLASHDGTTLIWRDGTRMPVSDGRTDKDFEELLRKPDIDDMFAFAYPPGKDFKTPGTNDDPGRIRFLPLFVKMYGDCRKGEVAGHLREIVWLPHSAGLRVKVTTANGVDQALEAVSAELDGKEELKSFLAPLAGIYNCRPVADTGELSAHSFGAAIDLNTKYADYWLWARRNPRSGSLWRNRYPLEIVEIFERHGFIWGGKWGHFDTMHFEYRPEMLIAAGARPILPGAAKQ
jgi:D-alanyl-D-alanine carboxypeptidase-like protein